MNLLWIAVITVFVLLEKGVAFWGLRWTSDGTDDDHCRWGNRVYGNISEWSSIRLQELSLQNG